MTRVYLKYIAVALCIVSTALSTWADDSPKIMRKDSVVPSFERPEDMVIVNGDTISMIIPEKNYGRFDRGLFNYLYIPKGQWSFGLTASFGNISTEDLQVLSVFDNVNFNAKIYSINPSVSYFIRHNQSLGLRFLYTRGYADLASLNMDIDDDMSIALHDVSYHSNSYKLGLFYRNYVGLNRNKRFAVFNEVSLNYGEGSSRFRRYYDDVLYDTHTSTLGLGLNFSPGLCVFIHDYVAFNVSFGVFGLRFERNKQDTNGTDEGTRYASGANFRFNIFNIDFGLLVVI